MNKYNLLAYKKTKVGGILCPTCIYIKFITHKFFLITYNNIMTVISVFGSSLDEVWGDVPGKQKSKKKSSKRTPSDQLCERSPSTQYDEIMDYYHPSLAGIYEKSRYSRTQHPLTETDAEERYDENKYISSSDPDVSKKLPPQAREYYVNAPTASIMHVTGKLNEDREKQYLDLSMYIFSGIALIFILEQFVSIGMALANK
jgi:hypothetical protein